MEINAMLLLCYFFLLPKVIFLPNVKALAPKVKCTLF